ncbi:Do family serine endopeptidase [Congregibacter variabilis]|uniref:Probable periplasmic serine endoprotease DegP-like n=1 Tax=Congregibacter variabilis TaxID=3081200 RepID=A0ABZ0I600_9GAMM|nr:Do family serine endopeptidase [Congregibacter sp. IMCC43200]
MRHLIGGLRATLLSTVALALLLSASFSRAVELPDFTKIVAQQSPAVVKIIVEASASGGGQNINEEEIPEFLRRYFQMPDPPQGPQGPQERMATGSGFIISDDGYVVTNHHVVEDADVVTVRLSDRREYEAEIVGLDPRSDLALLRIEAEKLPFLVLGADDGLQVGEWVLAIGSPFGLDYSVTAGIVSAKGRSLPTRSRENYVPFIQTDVAINPGNSGGPLFNLKGEVVGVNSQIFTTRAGGSIGLSFAIPVNVVRNVVTQLKEGGTVTRGWLGVTIQNVDRNLGESFGLDRPRGALISQIASDGPAAKSGLEPGDIIIEFDGESIETSADLPHVVGLIAPGTEVDVLIVRNRKQKTVEVEVGGLDADDSVDQAYRGSGEDSLRGGRLGIVVEEAPEEMLSRWDLAGGVVVRSVEPESPADEAGLMPGDVITAVGSTPVRSMDTFREIVEELEDGASVPLRLIRRGSPMFIGLRLKE